MASKVLENSVIESGIESFFELQKVRIQDYFLEFRVI